MDDSEGKLLVGDCLKLLPAVETESVDLVFCDPPYNVGYEYDQYQDNKSPQEYLEWSYRWLVACKRALKPTGSIWVAIGDAYAAQMKLAMENLGFCFRSWVIWHYTFGVNCTKNFTPSHTHLLYYAKSPKGFTWNGDHIRVRSARQTIFNDKRQKAGGRLPDNTWVLRPEAESRAWQHESDTWSVSRVAGTFKERALGAKGEKHPCQMPEEILERIIRVSSNTGDLVMDPMSGAGTTLAVAKRLNRKYLGMELSENYAEIIRKRLEIGAYKPQERTLLDFMEEQLAQEKMAP